MLPNIVEQNFAILVGRTVGQYRGSGGVFIGMIAGRVFGSFYKSILVPINISGLLNASKYSGTKFCYFGTVLIRNNIAKYYSQARILMFYITNLRLINVSF